MQWLEAGEESFFLAVEDNKQSVMDMHSLWDASGFAPGFPLIPPLEHCLCVCPLPHFNGSYGSCHPSQE